MGILISIAIALPIALALLVGLTESENYTRSDNNGWERRRYLDEEDYYRSSNWADNIRL